MLSEQAKLKRNSLQIIMRVLCMMMGDVNVLQLIFNLSLEMIGYSESFKEAGSSLRRVLAKGEPSSVIGDEPSPVDFQQEDKSEPTVVEENKSDPQEDKSEPPVLEEDKSEPPVVEDERDFVYDDWTMAPETVNNTNGDSQMGGQPGETGDGGEDPVEDGDDEGGSETESEHAVDNGDDEGGYESENEDVVDEGGSKIKGQHVGAEGEHVDDDLYDDDYMVEVGDEDYTENAEEFNLFREGHKSYGDSEELHTESDSENGGGERYPSFDAKLDIGKGKFKVGMLFKNVDGLKWQ
ncbi:unnamed protein product [Cuscuta campestris]|uniref:Uncharacterized protein n=1 Tax=Cuscuta campestris TaxID=132261 RepID=A0A484NJC8_9ASTE|nr:unnamed protein product [Cuscuta campestris]